MRPRSSLSDDQRAKAIAMFETGGPDAPRLESSLNPIRLLYDRWRVRGSGALVPKPAERSFTFEVMLGIVQRFLAGESKTDTAREFDLSSPKLIET
jgi:hypothetical protein